MQLCYNSHNGIKLALIHVGSSESDAIPEQVELVSANLKSMNTN